MKLFLTADLHDNRSWLEWLVDQAHNYDLICIAGDLLDMFAADEGGQIDHLRGNWLPKMIATGVPLAVCSGNHDHGMNAWLNYIDVPGKVVGDGSTQLLSLSGEQLIVTTCPYYRTFDMRDSVMIELWEHGARLRTETQSPWLVLHHEPPAQICPAGYTATHWLSLRLRTYRPDYVSCGHLHVFGPDFAFGVHGAWCLNSGQRSDAPRPNYIILDLSAKIATRVRMAPVSGTLSWVEERVFDYLDGP